MAVHARLKNEFMVDKKYHNIMIWLNLTYKKGENGRRNVFMTKSEWKNVLPYVRIEPATYK